MLQHDHRVLTTAFAPLQPPELPTMVAARSSFDGRRGLPLTRGSGNWGGGRCRCRPRLHPSRYCATPLLCPPGGHPAERRSATPHRRRCTAAAAAVGLRATPVAFCRCRAIPPRALHATLVRRVSNLSDVLLLALQLFYYTYLQD